MTEFWDTLTIKRELREANLSFIRQMLSIQTDRFHALADETVDDIAGALLRDARRLRLTLTNEQKQAALVPRGEDT